MNQRTNDRRRNRRLDARQKDLIETLDELHDRGVSMLPLNGQCFDLNSANGKLMRTSWTKHSR